MHTLVLFLVCLLFAPAAPSAEFDLDSGRVILRQLQYCTHCGSALLVTHVHPGAPIRCPDCGHEQPRIKNEFTLTQLYQICKTCQAPLDPHNHQPGDVVECHTCHTPQPLSRDAFTAADSGPGYAPGMPPGTNRKTLLLSPDKPDAAIAVVPLDDHLADIPEIRDAAIAAPITRPPETRIVIREETRRKQYPPIPELASTGAPAPSPTPMPKHDPAPVARAVDVPAVTANLFGKLPDGTDDPAYIPSGKILARVNGVPIHARDVDRVVNPVLQRLAQQAAPEDAERIAARVDALRKDVLQRLIDRELAVREADAIGFSPDPAAVREREAELAPVLAGTGVDIRREAERDVIMQAMRRRFAEKPGAASPEAVREFYRQHRDAMMQPRLVALDQLVVYEDRHGRADTRDSDAIALDIARQLEQGGRFDDLRAQYDEFAPAAGVQHPDPALQPEAAYAREILAAAGDLRKGAVFGPLFLPGMALFGKVADVRPAGPIPFEEVRNDIRRRLEDEAAEKSLDAWLQRLRHKATVELVD